MTMLEMCLIKICCAQAASAQGGREKKIERERRESEKQIQIKLTNA